ncbi:MAG TPA: glycine betaine ABC transporter substrate-binding protein [Pirellulales bacterium]|nr:glycine betaine ABC transporter substrate-binding protein [Pirellulales bacterium]
MNGRCRGWTAAACALATVVCSASADETPPRVTIGSKKFTESVILGDMLTLVARQAGADAVHLSELGGTQFVWKALLAGEIDIYAEYTGTLREEILAGENVPTDDLLRQQLAERGVVMSDSLGFNDTYALGMLEATAERLKIRTISELKRHESLKFGLSNEFMDREDGWPGLRRRYALAPTLLQGVDHDLAYRGLASGAIDVTDLYSTDAEIEEYGLRVLDDDLHYFPAYHAVLLYRDGLRQRAPAAVAAFRDLEGAIDESEMSRLNARAKLERVPEERVAADFLQARLGLTVDVRDENLWTRLATRTREHLYLVVISLLYALLLALPLGIIAARYAAVGQVILAVVGLIQTIPSLALLVFMIPLMGLGAKPAILALFLYSLLPIVRNTYVGLHDIPLSLRESAEALGMPPLARLRLIELPLASRTILAGIKTAAVINVGTATLGALIGAGGYGQPILTGIRLNDVGLILEGAIPSALLAVATQGAFELAERWLVPKGLRLKRG